MKNYQQMILDELENIALGSGRDSKCAVSATYNYSNNGRLIVSRIPAFTTIVTADFDFQSDRVRIMINNPGGPNSMMGGPRSDSTYWWTPGKSADDDEVNRLFDRWLELVQEGLK